MTTNTPRTFHVALAVAPYEVQATATGVQHALSLIQQVSPGAYGLTLSLHANPADLFELPSLDCGLLSAAGEPAEARADEIERIWSNRIQALAARGATTLMLNQFRCVNRQEPDYQERLYRIRELNRTQILVAQTNNLTIVDLDCVLADLGGAYLGCDYRLASLGGHAAVVYSVAQAMLEAGLRNKVDTHCLDEALTMLCGIDELRAAIDQYSRQHGNHPHG